MAERGGARLIPIRFGPGEWIGSIGDIGTMAPLFLSLTALNGLPAARSLVLVGAAYIFAALYFRIPMPVQPLKALAAIAIARGLGMNLIAAAAIWMGLILTALSLSGRIAWLSKFFTRPVVKGIQLGVGLMLIKASVGLLASVGASLPAPLPASWVLPGPGDFIIALWVLVIPQLPLTLGNSVFAVSEAAEEYFGPSAKRAAPEKISLSLGFANIVMGILGGLPVCHGSGGLTAHYRFGARSAGATLITGSAFILLAAMGGGAFHALKSLPAWFLGMMVLYVGFCHVGLAAKLDKGRATALVMGLVGLAASNLALALALGLAMENLPKLLRRIEARG